MRAGAAVRLSAGVFAACLGGLLMFASVPAVISATAIFASVGRSGVVSQPLGSLVAAEGDRAVVVDGVSARLVTPPLPEWVPGVLALAGTDAQTLGDNVGDVALVAALPTDTPGFLGVAPADAVNDYLDDVPYSVAVRPAGAQASVEGPWPTVSVPGTRSPEAPEQASLWAASATGTSPELPGTDLTGSTLVLMHVDAQPAPQAQMRLEYRVPGADRALEGSAVAAAAMSIGGLALVLLGGWAVVGRRPRA